jgi:CAAX protease family protein
LSASSFQIAVFEAVFLSALIVLGVALMRGRVRWIWLLPIPVIAFLGKLLMFEAGAGTFGDWISGRYNWEGKVIALVLWLGVAAALFRNKLATLGLTFQQNGPFRGIAFAVAALTAIATALWSIYYFPGVKSEPLPDILYQATMPTIEEELWFRGILLTMLTLGFTSRNAQQPSIAGVVLAATIVSLQFWGVHSIGTDGNWGFVFQAWFNPVAGIYGILWVIVRLGTGSLVLPMVLHTWANTAGYIL